jgi:predicted RNA polymerase sigma factor
MPDGRDLAPRLEAVLHAVYLLFNEGYSACAGPSLTKSEACDEAILLTSRLAQTSVGDQPQTHALLSVMLLHSSRLPARVGADGGLCLLEHQDRSQWDTRRIGRGMEELARSASGPVISRYHHEASIAAIHALAPSYAETDWNAVLREYDALATLAASPVILLNRAIARSKVEGPERALDEIRELENYEVMLGYYLLPATKGALLIETGRTKEAQAEFVRALDLAKNPLEKRFLEKRLAELG